MNVKDIELIRKMLKKQAKLDKAIMEEYGLEELDEEKLSFAILDELDYIVYASKLYGGKHVMEELDNRYKNKLMS